MIILISIHAPTKGATTLKFIASGYDLFQSTLPRRERRLCDENTEALVCISIHAPTKGATPKEIAEKAEEYISIHAPTKGATVQAFPNLAQVDDFNPRSHEGSDNFSCDFSSISKPFQSTLPRRERPGCANLLIRLFLFQSTLPRRERPKLFVC